MTGMKCPSCGIGRLSNIGGHGRRRGPDDYTVVWRFRCPCCRYELHSAEQPVVFVARKPVEHIELNLVIESPLGDALKRLEA